MAFLQFIYILPPPPISACCFGPFSRPPLFTPTPPSLSLLIPPTGDPEGRELDLAAGLRRVAREGLGAPLEDLEVQPGGERDQEDEADETPR